MTPERIAELRALAGELQRGPWHWRLCYEVKGPGDVHWALESEEGASRQFPSIVDYRAVLISKDPNMELSPALLFMAAAPDLLDALEDANREIERLKGQRSVLVSGTGANPESMLIP